ncbi:hypothetical protein JJC04_15450 [Flavobacterium covae]|nr:hypothetical protein [Flavobacterium covae]QYS91150.1 hypothetical protein JJC04_15450 [Flavobacterium covae]
MTFEYQKETIKVDELLNILWLSQPRINSSLDNDDLIDIGLSSIVAYTLNDSLPKANIIRELESNIQKYRGEKITDKDILNISTRISNKQLRNIAELNKIAEKNSAEFIEKLKVEADLQQKVENQRVERFEELYKKFQDQVSTLQKAKSQVESKEELLKEKSKALDESIKQLDNKKILKTKS